jgi:DNA-binding LacI/PurR family transcriptional regulator
MKNETAKGLKYLKISKLIQQKITGGDYQPGEQIPTQNELANVFNVSRPTVEKAFDMLEKKGLIIRKKGAGTFVSGHLESSPSQTKFGILAPRPSSENDFEHNFINTVISRISNESKLHNFSLFSDTASFDDPQQLLHHGLDTCEKFINENVKGVFYIPVDFTDDNETINHTMCETLDKNHIQIILVDRDIYQMPKRSKFDVIGINNRRAAYRITNHLIQMGLKDLYFVSCKLNSNVVRERIEGFKDATAAANLKANIILDYNFKDTQKSTQRLRELMLNRPKPQGLVCINDEAASVIMRDALKLEIQLPEELRITGFDDLPTSSLLYCPLTTIKQPVHYIASQAVAKMFDRISNPNTPALDIFVTEELVIRES